ncbi:MAG: hypothetical protein ACYSSI_02790 [Planctomycetota bacterium]|jgi:hypothetical protein
MLKKTYKILVVPVLFCVIGLSTLCLGGYKASKITYTVSGSVGLGGVVMKGLPGSPVSNENGNYIATVDYGWSGTVTPTKEGYTFEPANRNYKKVTGDQGNQNYTATLITLLISGTAGQGGVVMSGLPGNPTTDEKGSYKARVDYGFIGTVTPTKEGYTFEPASKKYSSVSSNLTNESYIAKLRTVIISGSTGMDGVVMKGLLGNPVTSKGGLYTVLVNYGWKGNVTPTREGYTFEPASRSYDKVTGNKIDQSYSGTVITYVISGTAGEGGVLMRGLPGNPVTDEKGSYTATVAYNWSGTVTPTKEGYTIEPASKRYSSVTNDKINQSYIAKLKTFTISGSIGMNGVEMSGLPGNPVTDANGHYTATLNYGWSGMVAPMKEGYVFEPANRIYNKVIGNQSNQSYSGKLITLVISGMAGEGGVVMRGLPGDPVTNENGYYTATVKYGWNGTVAPSKKGYNFEPIKKTYTKVTVDKSQDYKAALQTFVVSGRITTADKMPISGVVINGLLNKALTDDNGYYSGTVNYGWSGAVAPIKEGYTFDAAKRQYAGVTSDKTGQDYIATLLTFTVFGTIIIDGKPVEGILMTADNGGGTGTTNANGKYVVTVPYGWSGSIAPTKEGYMFDPPSKEYFNVISNIDEDRAERMAEHEVNEQQVIKHGSTEQRVVAESRPVEPKVHEIEGQFETNSANLVEKLRTEVKSRREVTNQLLINNVFIDTELRQVLQDIASQAGVSIIPDQTVTGLVTCELKDIPLERALEIVLAGTGYVVTETPDYYLISSPSPKDAAFTASSRTRSIKLNYVDAETAIKLLSTVFKDYVKADAVANTVYVTAPVILMSRIEADLRLIDQPPCHIMLDARVVVMESSDLLNMGIEWGWPKIKAGIFSNDEHRSKWPWGIQIGYGTDRIFTNSLELTLNLLEENGEATIVSSPQVMAQDGKEAEIRITTEEYFSLLPKYESGSAYYYQRFELEKIEYGTILKIIPHVGKNGDITLDLAIEVSDVVMRKEDDFPIVSRRNVRNTMRIKDGGTVAVAGLEKSESHSTKRKVPGAGKLPLIGGLFRDKSNKGHSQQVAIFVTAHLIPESKTSSYPSSGPSINKEKYEKQASPVELHQKDFKRRLQKNLSRPD